MRLEPLDYASERRLTRPASFAACLRAESIDGLRTSIDQVTAEALKDREESFVSDRGVQDLKRLPHCSVQPGVLLVEELARSGRGLTDKEQAHSRGAIPPPKPLARKIPYLHAST